MAKKSLKENLAKAKKNKNDEFFTQLTDIDKELKHYKHHFKGKVIFCNCDDPRVSNFFHYFSYNFMYFHNLQNDQKEQILNYKLMVYICSGTDSEKLEWFKTINIAGEKLTEQELRNAVYSGSWVSDAKRYFSKNAVLPIRLEVIILRVRLSVRNILKLPLIGFRMETSKFICPIISTTPMQVLCGGIFRT